MCSTNTRECIGKQAYGSLEERSVREFLQLTTFSYIILPQSDFHSMYNG